MHQYICDFQYPLSYEDIQTLLLYTDLYVVVFKLLNLFGWQNIGGIAPLPPVHTAMSDGRLDGFRVVKGCNGVYCGMMGLVWRDGGANVESESLKPLLEKIVVGKTHYPQHCILLIECLYTKF